MSGVDTTALVHYYLVTAGLKPRPAYDVTDTFVYRRDAAGSGRSRADDTVPLHGYHDDARAECSRRRRAE
jgi:hypothetical protein